MFLSQHSTTGGDQAESDSEATVTGFPRAIVFVIFRPTTKLAVIAGVNECFLYWHEKELYIIWLLKTHALKI